jgi:membrane protease YdiL (CAAX protease family)
MLSEKPWRAEAVIQFFAAQFAVYFLGAAAMITLHKFGVGGFRRAEDFGNVLLATLSFQGATWILIAIFLRQHEMNWREAFGFRDPKLKSSLLRAVVLLLFIAAPVAWGLQEISAQILTRLGQPVEDQAAVALFKDVKAVGEFAYLSFFAVVLAPVAEEFIFRGILFPFLKQRGFPKLAWIGVSALFALIHFNLATFLPLFAFALVLTWLYEKTDNLLAPITAHALFNAVNLALIFYTPN